MRGYAANGRVAPRRNVNRRADAARRRAWVGRLAAVVWTLAGAAFVVFVSFFFVFVHDMFTQSPHFTARQIQVEGARRLPPRTVAAIAGVREGINVLSVNLSAARRQLLAHPWIAEAEIRREIPSGLHIQVREHEPAAVVDIGKRFLLNVHGEIFKEWEPGDPAGLPVVSGLKPACAEGFRRYCARTPTGARLTSRRHLFSGRDWAAS